MIEQQIKHWFKSEENIYTRQLGQILKRKFIVYQLE